MARIAENAVIQDGVWYNPGEEIPDLGNWVRVHHDGAKRYYEGVTCLLNQRSETFIKSVERQSFSMAVGMRLLRQNNRRM